MIDAQTQAWIDQEDAQYVSMVRRHGWMIQWVCGCTLKESREEGPPFAYTVGLFGLHHPELLILGVDQDIAAGILNTLGDRIRAGETLMPGMMVTFDDNPWRIVPEPVPNPGEILFTANGYYDRPPWASVPALQLSYTDRRGRFPWERDYAAPRMQPRPGTFDAHRCEEMG
jgi:Domain of unknown function (DUF4262)